MNTLRSGAALACKLLLLLYAAFLLPLTLLLVFLPWEPDVRFGFPESSEEESKDAIPGRSTILFDANGTGTCEGWLYMPRHSSSRARPPIIIMASGLGMSRDIGLPAFASTFAEKGYAVLLFDYLTWGGSQGQPRQLVAPRLHVLDYLAAIKHVQATDGLHGHVDPARVILWGTSYSGGHALAAASQLGNAVSAVVTMESFTSPLLIALAFFYLRFCPYAERVPAEEVVPCAPVTAHMSVETTTGAFTPPIERQAKEEGKRETATKGSKSGCPWLCWDQGIVDLMQLILWEVLAAVASVVRGVRMFLVGVSDVLRGALGLQAAYVPIVLPASAVAARLRKPWGVLRTPLSLGVLTDKDYMQMMSAMPKRPLGGWQNLTAARMLFFYPFYRPLKDAAGLSCPVLMIAGKHDLLTPEHSIRKAAKILAQSVGKENVAVVNLPGTHISLYKAPLLLPTMLNFLAATVPLRA